MLPDDSSDLFESLVSQRAQQQKLHFGLGLYIVRVIAEYHKGRVRAVNLADGSGVAIAVELPLAQSARGRDSSPRSLERVA